ncbi:membrane or secreted protein [Formosa sp. PL04]|uniref:membrane or secreted protein n=1 Tax=Formosa sp. PL04 TaxID=3081755 RepID=UPI002981415D|nr:membrane or secreted protein [Formosa sp. PL04]MDW5290702.1 membrane or secreted protein [Formosa sp. PL04]
MILLICAFLSFTVKAQSPIGAWESMSTSENGDAIRIVVIFTDGYQVLSKYNATTGKFIQSNGGTWTLEGDTMTEKIEFNTDDPEQVGTEVSFQVDITDTSIQIIGYDMTLNRIDNGKPGALQGAWLMSGRIKNGETQLRDTSSPRKTMKILSGTQFQWIAYNTETKEFMGTGGGTYTTKNGEYSENIEFFSKDDSKVGLSLNFNYELIDNNWHHSGLSSKGDPINEIWSLRD